jgi:tRNA nucleotidyltransferase (CCA-adding enzyme)
MIYNIFIIIKGLEYLTSSLPQQVNNAIRLLKDNGFEAYCVGGCVRDMVMNKEPHDYDITTNAAPDEMKRVFDGFRVIETGIKHGTLTVISDGMPLEITAYRVDGEYLDNRHPETVTFSRELKDDLSRRDFTVNTLCYNEDEGIIDLFGGIEDINNKTIRCVGEPDKRFSEDALRIIRALRFAAVLGFEIEPETAKSILTNKDLLSNIAIERIRDEFTKLICADKVYGLLNEYHTVIEVFLPEISALRGCGQNTPYHIYDVFEHTLRAVEGIENDKTLRLTMLLHDIAKPVCKKTDENGQDHFKGHAFVGSGEALNILKRLRYDNKTVDKVCKLIAIHSLPVPNTKAEAKHFLNEHGVENSLDFIKVRFADLSAKANPHCQDERLERFRGFIDEIITNNECFTLSQLEVNGNDLKETGITNGKAINRVLSVLLTEVMEESIENKKEALLKRANEYAKTDSN